ncbi:MAG: DUF6573 family protein [Pirellulales bacterium]
MTTTTERPNRKEGPADPNEEWPVIHAYTRAEAIADGVLVAVGEKMARDAGFRVPVALTREVHETYVRVPEGVRLQCETGRLWDILWMTRHAYQNDRSGNPVVTVHLDVRNSNQGSQPVKLKACLGPGDAGECVLTIMMPGES